MQWCFHSRQLGLPSKSLNVFRLLLQDLPGRIIINSLSFNFSKCFHRDRSSLTTAAFTATQTGEVATTEFRIKFASGDKPISPWHDIPLKDGEFYNFINEIPKYTKAKLEVATKETYNPIAQDIKKGKLRDYHGPIYWTYGCLPQTWEDPNVLHPEVNCKGDNDPVDVVEIGAKALASGSLTKVQNNNHVAIVI